MRDSSSGLVDRENNYGHDIKDSSGFDESNPYGRLFAIYSRRMKEGEKVIIEGGYGLKDGTRVRVK